MDVFTKLKREGIRVNNHQIHKKDIDKISDIIQHKVFGLPMLISSTDFVLKKELDGDETNKKMYEKLINKSSRKELIKLDPNGYLYQVGHKIFLANKDTKRIDYYVQYELQHSFKLLTVTQIAIWMEYASKYADLPNGQRISKYVFFEILLPLTDAIVTDSLQTIDGERFWINRIREAITSNMFVYAVYKDKNKIVRIETEEQLRKIKPNIWGDKKHHENRKIFISKTEIFPQAEKYKE